MSVCDACGRETDDSLLEDFNLYTTYNTTTYKHEGYISSARTVTTEHYSGTQKHHYVMCQSCKRRGARSFKLYLGVPFIFGFLMFGYLLLFEPTLDTSTGTGWYILIMLSFCVVPLFVVIPSTLVLRLFKPENKLGRRATKAHVLDQDQERKYVIRETEVEYKIRNKPN